MSSQSVVASPKVLNLLKELHVASSTQEASWAHFFYYFGKYLRSFFVKQKWSPQDDDFMRDKFIALESDKSEFVYLLARTTGATTIVEAGTSFGVSTIYLALAAGQNALAKSGPPIIPGRSARVIATEKESSKAARAREYWKQAGEEVEPWINLLEGDLLELLPKEMESTEEVDLLLLDSMLNSNVILI